MSLTLRHFYKFDSFVVDVNERVLFRDGRMVPLTPKVFETLLLLVRNQGSIVTKEKMLDTLWPDVFVEESNVTFNITMLRKALGDTKRSSVYIETVPRRGYRFKTQVREIVGEDASAETERPEVLTHSGNGRVESRVPGNEARPALGRSEKIPQTLAGAWLTPSRFAALIRERRMLLLLAILGAVVLLGTATVWRLNRHSSVHAGEPG